MASASLDPVLRESLSNVMDKSIANDLARKGAKEGISPEEFARLKQLSETSKQTPELERVLESVNKQAVEKGSQALSREQILKNRLRRGGLATLGAAGIGAVPAILAMKDQPAESLPVI